MSTRHIRWIGLLLRLLIAWLSIHSSWYVRYRDAEFAQFAGYNAIFDGQKNSACFCRFHLLGWEVPYAVWWLSYAGAPELDSVRLNGRDAPITPEMVQVAQQAREVDYWGGKERSVFDRFASDRLEQLQFHTDLNREPSFAFVERCPNLRKLEASFIQLSPASMKLLFGHAKLQYLECEAHVADLSQVEVLPRQSGLQELSLQVSFFERDWMKKKLARPPPRRVRIPAPGEDEPEPKTALGTFIWLKQCPQFRRLTIQNDASPAFFRAIGEHLEGIERLEARFNSPEEVECIAGWKRLRFLSVETNSREGDRAALVKINELCPQLETLEIDSRDEKVTPLNDAWLESLRGMKNLKRLRLAFCNLSKTHLEEIAANLPQLEAISIEDRGVSDAELEPLLELKNLAQVSLERTRAKQRQRFQVLHRDWEDRPWRAYVQTD